MLHRATPEEKAQPGHINQVAETVAQNIDSHRVVKHIAQLLLYTLSVMLCCLLLSYWLEKDSSVDQQAVLHRALGRLVLQLLHVPLKDSENFTRTVFVEKKVVGFAKLYCKLGGKQLGRYWTYENSLLYVLSVITTIGYGRPVPNTTGGQVYTIFVAVLGIPFTYLVVNDLGVVLFICQWETQQRLRAKLPVAFRFILRKLEAARRAAGSRWRAAREAVAAARRDSAVGPAADDSIDDKGDPGLAKDNGTPPNSHDNIPSPLIQLSKSHIFCQVEDVDDENVEEEEKEEEPKIEKRPENVPMKVAAINLLVYVTVTSYIYAQYEAWSYVTSCYFVVTSITTVGFGDVLPERLWFPSIFIVFVGLSLVANLVSAIHRAVKQTYHRAVIKVATAMDVSALKERRRSLAVASDCAMGTLFPVALSFHGRSLSSNVYSRSSINMHHRSGSTSGHTTTVDNPTTPHSILHEQSALHTQQSNVSFVNG